MSKAPILLVLLAICRIVAAQPLPLEVYQQREQQLGDLAFYWTVDETFTSKMPVHKVNRVSGEWVVLRGRSLMKVTGIRNTSVSLGDPDVEKTEYYGMGWGLWYERVPPSLTPNGLVWASPDDAAYFRHPHDRVGLNLLPEDFVLIAGKNLFKVYGAKWTVVSQGEKAFVVQTEVSSGNFAPFKITATLDPVHGWLPVQIRTEYQRGGNRSWTRTWQVRGYQRIRDVWFPKEIWCREEDPNVDLQRKWLLRKVEPLGFSVDVSVPTGAEIEDHRLVGTNLTDAQATQASMNPETSRVTAYKWSGSLPDLAQIEQILRQRQMAQQTRPQQTPRASLWYRFIPPLLLITIGILWYWRLKRAEGKR